MRECSRGYGGIAYTLHEAEKHHATATGPPLAGNGCKRLPRLGLS